jgi:hypothetical protein
VLPTAPATTAVGAPSAFPVTTASAHSPYPAAGGHPGPVTVSAVNRALPATRAVAAAASAASARAVQRTPTVQRNLLGSAFTMVSSFAKEWIGGSSGSSSGADGPDIRADTLRTVISPMSPLVKSDQWEDLVKVLAECVRLATRASTSHTNETVKAATESTKIEVLKEVRDKVRKEIIAEVHVDEVLYSNTSRRLRADMRIDRERFGRLRDGTR